MLQSRQISRKDAVIPGETEQPERASGERFGAVTMDSALANKTRLSTRALSVVPLAAAVALVIHLFLSTNEPAAEGRTYTLFLSFLLLRSHSPLRSGGGQPYEQGCVVCGRFSRLHYYCCARGR